MKVIKYYSKKVFGNDCFYIHPDSQTDANHIKSLLKRETITQTEMTLLQFVSGGGISFHEAIAPRN